MTREFLQAFCEQVLADMPLVPDAEMSDYVARILENLNREVRQSRRADPPTEED